MHTKRKGNIGQFATALVFSKYEFSVFTEEGDISTIDIVAEKRGRLYRIQCKAAMPKKNVLILSLVKSGKNYCRLYNEKEIDFFSLYDLLHDKLYLIPSKILKSHSKAFTLRLTPTKNQQYCHINMAEKFLAHRILRDYTRDTPPDLSEGNDIVQTTTAETLAG